MLLEGRSQLVWRGVLAGMTGMDELIRWKRL